MRVIREMLSDIESKTFDIGFVGEKNHTCVMINCVSLFKQYPDAVATMVARPPIGDIYPVVLHRDGVFVVWNISESDIANAGSGQYQLTFTDGEGDNAEIIKTVYGSFSVKPSMVSNGEAPDPIEDWLEEANEALAEFGKINELSASATTLEAGSEATAEITTVSGHKNIAIGVPKGDKGDKGDDGDPAPAEEVTAAVDAYLAENFSNPSNPPLDRSLSSSSSAAPADMVGDLKSAFDNLFENGSYLITGSDLSRGLWSNRQITPTTTNLCSSELIPVKAGDQISIKANGWYWAYAVYQDGQSSASGSTGWQTSDAINTINYTGGLFLLFKKNAAGTDVITQADYPCEIKIDSGVIYHIRTDLDNAETLLDETSEALIDLSKNLYNKVNLKSYTEGAGVYGIDGSVNTGNTVFEHLELTLTGESLLGIAGFCYGNNYRAWLLMDSSNNIIAYDDVTTSSSIYFKEVLIPDNASKLIVNVRKGDYPRGIFDIKDTVESASDIKTLVDVGGKLHLGYVYHITDGDKSGTNYVYRELSVSGGETFYISGRHMGGSYPLFIVFDANGEILYNYSYTLQSDANISNLEVTLPIGARKIIVNGTFNQIDSVPVIRQYSTNTVMDVENDLSDNVNSRINLKSILPTITEGKVAKIDGTFAEASNYRYCSCNVTGGETYYINGRNYTDNYPLYIIYDSNNNIIEVPRVSNGQLTANTRYFNYRVICPINADHMIVNSITGADLDVKIKESTSLYDVLAESKITGVYKVRTPVKELTCDLEGGTWVANQTKTNYNMQFFSRAYAVMLDRIMTTYPNAQVICCTINEAERTTEETGVPERNMDGGTIKDYNEIIEYMAKAFGAILVDHHCCGITYYNLSDYMQDYSSSTGAGLHPNAAGMTLIANQTIKDLTGYNFEGKKLSVYGDSISTYNGTGSTNNQYPSGDIQDVSKMWWYESCIAEMGMTLLTNGSGGGRSVTNYREGISGRPKSGYNQDAIDALKSNGTNPDVIIIKLGINDFGNVGQGSNVDLYGNKWYGGL